MLTLCREVPFDGTPSEVWNAEAAYAELVEFVRVGVQLLYEHLQPLREPAPTGPRETLH